MSHLAKHAIAPNICYFKRYTVTYGFILNDDVQSKITLATFSFRLWLSIIRLKGENILIAFKTFTSTHDYC